MPPRSSPSITSTTKRAKCLSGSHSSTDGGRRNAVRRSKSRKLLIAIKPPFGANQWRDSSENQRRWVKSDRLLDFVFDLARRLDHDPPGVEVYRRGDPPGEWQEQGFAAADRRDLENVAAAVVHHRHDPAERRAAPIDSVEADEIVVVEFVIARRRQLVAAGED